MKSGNRDKAEGAMKDAKGSAEEHIGRSTGNRDLEREGNKDQARGKGQKAVGDIKKSFDQ